MHTAQKTNDFYRNVHRYALHEINRVEFARLHHKAEFKGISTWNRIAGEMLQVQLGMTMREYRTRGFTYSETLDAVVLPSSIRGLHIGSLTAHWLLENNRLRQKYSIHNVDLLLWAFVNNWGDVKGVLEMTTPGKGASSAVTKYVFLPLVGNWYLDEVAVSARAGERRNDFLTYLQLL